MHELSIASSIIEIAEEEVHKAGATRVLKISLDIGALSGVVIEAMEFAMDVAVKNTVLELSEITINKIPGKAKCEDCGFEFPVEELYSPCTKCGSFRLKVTEGNELKIGSMYVE